MPRRREVPKRKILPDPKYNNKILARFVNVLMRKGKKSTAEAICYQALDRIKEKISDDPIIVFKKAIDNLKPSLEVKSRYRSNPWSKSMAALRCGEATYPAVSYPAWRNDSASVTNSASRTAPCSMSLCRL